LVAWILARNVLFLDEAILLLDKLEPRPHVAELLENIGVHLFGANALAVGPATDNPFAQSQLTGVVELAGTRLLPTLEVLMYLFEKQE